jgi:signal peptide peptidase SppA
MKCCNIFVSLILVLTIAAFTCYKFSIYYDNKIENNKYGLMFYNYNLVHYKNPTVYNKSKVVLVYEFDTLNNIGKIGNIFQISTDMGFESMEYFISTVIHKFSKHNDTTVIFRLSSPGGSIYEYGRLYSTMRLLADYKIKTMVFIDDVCASGCYMLAIACDKIIATETASIGSIGVVTKHINYHELLKKIGIREKIIGTSKKKIMSGFDGTDDVDEQYKSIQEVLEHSMELFFKLIKKNRQIDFSKFDPATVWHGDSALQYGLIDEIGNMDKYLYELSKTNSSNIYYVTKLKRETVGNNFLLGILKNFFM